MSTQRPNPRPVELERPVGGGIAVEMWRADDSGKAVRDTELLWRVFDRLEREPGSDWAELRVAVTGDAVTLTGFVDSYIAKVNAEQAARRTRGVRLVRNLLTVVPPLAHQRSDADLRLAATKLLEWNVLLAHARLEVSAVAGWLLLEGELARESERRVAEETLQPLVGIRGLRNFIVVQESID